MYKNDTKLKLQDYEQQLLVSQSWNCDTYMGSNKKAHNVHQT